MTREEAIKEINKVFVPAFANYIITALTEGATVSDKEATPKNDLGVDWETYKDVDGNSLDDLILEVLQNNFDCGNTYGYKVADEIIGLLPSVTLQESRWISVTERLPKDGKTVIASVKGAIYPEARYEEGYGWEWAYESGADYWEELEDVTAWMPLPKPYKEG